MANCTIKCRAKVVKWVLWIMVFVLKHFPSKVFFINRFTLIKIWIGKTLTKITVEEVLSKYYN